MKNGMFDLTMYGNTHCVTYSTVVEHVLESYPYFDHMLIYSIVKGKFVNPMTVYENYLHSKYEWLFELRNRNHRWGTQTGRVTVGNQEWYQEQGKGLFSDITFSKTREARLEYMEPPIRKAHSIPSCYDFEYGGFRKIPLRNWKRTKVRKQYMKHAKQSKTMLPTKLDWDFDE